MSESMVTIWFSARVTLPTQTDSFISAEGDMAQAVQNEIGHTGAVVEEAWVETREGDSE